MNNPVKIIDHHAGGSNAAPLASALHFTVDDVDGWHKDRWPGFTSKQFKNSRGEYYHVGYHFVIESNGVVTQTRGLDEEGAHCIGMNTKSIGILTMGNFDRPGETPTPKQIQARVDLHLRLRKELPNITLYDVEPHRKYANKSCFGRNLADNFWRTTIESRLRERDVKQEQKEYEDARHIQTVLLEQLQTLLVQLQNLLALKKRLSIREK